MQDLDIDKTRSTLARSSAEPTAARWANSQQSLWQENTPTTDFSRPPVLHHYLNFREFLQHYYLFRRATHQGRRPYNYSVFSAAADIKSPNYLKLIIEGKRNLSDEMILKFAKALQFNKAEASEFRLLVFYGQEKDPLKRNQYLRDLADLRVLQQIESGELEKESYEQVPSWVAWALFAMCDQENVRYNMDELRTLFRGKVSEDQIRQAMKRLVENQQIKLQDQEFSRNPEYVPKTIAPALVRKLQAELNYLGMESLFEDSAKVREFGSLTIALTEEEFERYRFELRQLRKRIHRENAVSRESNKGQRVYQINLQLFPLTDPVRNP